MEWAIENNSANILTHLRELGYSIPLNIIERYPKIIRDYLLGEKVTDCDLQISHLSYCPV